MPDVFGCYYDVLSTCSKSLFWVKIIFHQWDSNPRSHQLLKDYSNHKIASLTIYLATSCYLPTTISKVTVLTVVSFYLPRYCLSCHPSYTDRILSQPSLAVRFAKIYGSESVTISLRVSLTKRLIRSSNGNKHHAYPFCMGKRGVSCHCYF